MFLKIRKLIPGAAAVLFSLLLSACGMDLDFFSPSPPPPPPVAVKDVTTPAPAPDTPPLYCVIGHGSALFGRDWYDFSEAGFALYRGEPADIKLTRVHSNEQMTVRALFDGSGQKLIFCPFLNVQQDQRISCSSLYALDDDLHDGIKRTFDIPSAVRGGAITCAYEQEHLRSLKTPAAGGN